MSGTATLGQEERRGSSAGQDLRLEAPPTPREIRRAIAGLMLVLTLASLDGNIVGPALPRIVSDLGGLAHLSWVVTGFAVAATATTPLYGKLSDQFGRRAAFFVSIGIFLAGSVLCGAARSMPALIGSRALQGIGAGGLIVLSQATIADLVSPRERGRYQGLIAAVFTLCTIAGPLLGGVITDMFSWPWIFYINLPIGAAALAILAVSLPRQKKRVSRGIDLPGFALLIGGTCSGMLMLSWGGVVYPWSSPLILGLGAAAALMFGLLVPVEHRAAEPAMPPRLFADRVFFTGLVSLSLHSAALFGALVFVPLYFQLVFGLSATEAGLRIAPLMGGLIVSSTIGGRLVTRTGRYKPYPVAGFVIATISYAALSYAAHLHATANVFDAGLVVLGLGAGLIMPNITTAVQGAVVPADLGIATATLGFFRSLGSALGVAVAGALLAATLHARTSPESGAPSLAGLGLSDMQAVPPALHQALTGAYGHAIAVIFAAACVVSTVGLCFALLIPDRKLRERETVSSVR